VARLLKNIVCPFGIAAASAAIERVSAAMRLSSSATH
jgi:hypothetical protein